MRNYRDGKHIDLNLCKDQLLKLDSNSDRDKRFSHRNDEKNKKEKTEKLENRHSGKIEDESKLSTKKIKHKTSSRDKSREVFKSSGGHRTSNETKNSRNTKSHNHHHHHHRHSSKYRQSENNYKHHRHHHHSTKSNQSDRLHISSKVDNSNCKKESTNKTSNYQSYPIIKTLDSKKIYSDGIVFIYFIYNCYFNY